MFDHVMQLSFRGEIPLAAFMGRILLISSLRNIRRGESSV